LYASSASATAKYYTQYLTDAPGEEPGVWVGAQAAGLGLSGVVAEEALERLLRGRDPRSGVSLGTVLSDRLLADGRVVRAVAGFDATVSAPKSLSVWWALTGDPGLVACHDVAVAAVVDAIERFGSTTRVRSNGGRLHPDSQGLTVAAFRQSTSRLDDPQLHTHLVISAKVQTGEGRWLALDARVLKQHQRAFGGLYQSVLRAELTHRYGVGFGEIVTGQAEIAGIPGELLAQFSKRAAQVDEAVAVKVAEFRDREGRGPSRFERAAIEREAAADTRARKSGHGVGDLRTRWLTEAAEIGITPEILTRSIGDAAHDQQPVERVSVADVVEELSSDRSVWHRFDIMRALTDRLRPQPGVSGQGWVDALDHAVERVLDACVDLDPVTDGGAQRRRSDGRSLWIEPVAPHVTSALVLAQEEAILTWVLDHHPDTPQPSPTLNRTGLDVLQGDAAAAVAGSDPLVVVVGPAGTGKTTMLTAAVTDLDSHGRIVFGLAPTAKAARVLARETGITADTVAKLLHEWSRPEGPGPGWRFPTGATIVVDEAGMLATADLHTLTQLATGHGWRMVLVGDARQLQAVGRGGMFAEICANHPIIELETIHRFTHRWEAAASLQLRQGSPQALDAYQTRGRIVAGSFEEHLDTIATAWLDHHQHGTGLAITTTTNDHVDAINHHIQQQRLDHGQLDPTVAAVIADGTVYVGDVVATRRNDRRLLTDAGDMVRNRERWTVTAIDDEGVSVSRIDGHGTITLPPDYSVDYLRLGYAATEPGNQADTQTASITLAAGSTTGRGLYVAMTRGRECNHVLVVTDTNDIGEARDILDAVLAVDRADSPAVTQRQHLARQDPRPQPQPRCDIPDWFPSVRADALADFRAALVRFDATAAERDRLAGNVEAARHRWAAADQACAPTDTATEHARRAFTDACEQERDARAALDNSGLRGRRQARTNLNDAHDRLAAAERAWQHAEDSAREPNRVRATALHQLVEARGDLERHDQFTRWHYLPEQLAFTEQRLDVLDIWHDWADGHPVTREQLGAAVYVLEASRQDQPDRVLATLARSWAELHHIAIDCAQPVPQIETPCIEIGL
jgi:conjugative relaxase-like TrwC/TraI family protein